MFLLSPCGAGDLAIRQTEGEVLPHRHLLNGGEDGSVLLLGDGVATAQNPERAEGLQGSGQAGGAGQGSGQASGQDGFQPESDSKGTGQTESGQSQAAAETKAPADESTLPPTGGRGDGEDQTVSAASYKVYTVADGETLYGICFKLYHNLQHIDEICRVNSLADENNIFAGQKLLVP